MVMQTLTSEDEIQKVKEGWSTGCLEQIEHAVSLYHFLHSSNGARNTNCLKTGIVDTLTPLISPVDIYRIEHKLRTRLNN